MFQLLASTLVNTTSKMISSLPIQSLDQCGLLRRKILQDQRTREMNIILFCHIKNCGQVAWILQPFEGGFCRIYLHAP